MDDGSEIQNRDSQGDEPSSLDTAVTKSSENVAGINFKPIAEFNKKHPKIGPLAVKCLMRCWFFLGRIPTFLTASAFYVVFPLTPTILYVVKNGSISRETLITTGIMQVLSFLNTEYKCGGMAVFVAYILGFAFCAYVQDWTLSSSIVFKSPDDFVQYTFCKHLINGHLLDSFLIVGIMLISVLNCNSVLKTYLLGFEKHWFWEDLVALSKKKEQPKAIEDNQSK